MMEGVAKAMQTQSAEVGLPQGSACSFVDHDRVIDNNSN
jgi:hypothetical protein